MNPAMSLTIQNFYHYVLLCRPSDPIQFAADYFEDEHKLEAEYCHALRCLKYLVFNDSAFRDAAAIIFSTILSRDAKEPQAGGLIEASVAKRTISNMFDECYLPAIPSDIREFLDAAISVPVLSLKEFTIYLKLITSCVVMYRPIRDVILEATSELNSSSDFYKDSDSIKCVDLLAILTTPRIRMMLFKVPDFRSQALYSSSVADASHTSEAFEAVIKNHMKTNSFITASDILRGLMVLV